MKPLISFCLFCYNQERYIKSSLGAAFAQTYSPLEIVISDDASTDRTWQIILEAVSHYKGPHKVVVNRNDKNLGVIGNWNKCCSLASGELLVKGDGDDISFPNRVERLVAAWVEYDKTPLLLSSSYLKIDMDGKPIGEFILPIDGRDERDDASICSGVPFFHIGTASAYSRRLFETFGPVKHSGAVDDATYEGRAVLLGGSIVGVKDILVMYRIGSGVTTGYRNYRKTISRGISYGMYARYQRLEDLESIKRQLSEKRYDNLKEMFEQSAEHHKTILKLWTAKRFGERFAAYRKLVHRGDSLKSRYIMTALLLPEWLDGCFLELPQTLSNVLKRIY